MTMLAFHALVVAALQVAPAAPVVPVTVTVPVRVAPVIVSVPVAPSVVAFPVITVAYQAAPVLDLVPREPWAAQDPADSLYRQARRVLNRGEYRQAADLFQRITQRYPRSAYAGDALYWRAFALYRVGGTEELRSARNLLQEQARRYAQAETRTNGDARTLATRVDGELARRGDAEAAERVSVAAEGAPRAPGAQGTPPSGAQPRPGTQPRQGTQGSCPTEDDDDDPRVAALNALMQMDADNAVPILKKVLARRDACSVGLRRKAVFLVSQKRSDETEAILLDAVRNDPDKEVREQAVFWLSQVPSERTAILLDSLLRTSPDREIQEKALFALSQHRSPKAGEALRAYALRTSAPCELREQAVFWLGQHRADENAAFLRDLFGKVTECELREKIIFSLSQMKSQENARWLLDVARNEQYDTEMRKHALFWAGQGGAPIADLVAIYDRMPDREMKEQLIFVYSQRGRDSAAIDKLFDIARNDRDPELRKKAIFWIGQSKDPRAAQFLSDLINQP